VLAADGVSEGTGRADGGGHHDLACMRDIHE
jgi:hypothetical protein